MPRLVVGYLKTAEVWEHLQANKYKKMNNKYLEKANKLSEAVVIAENVVTNSSNLPETIKNDL
jgi:hypothetical protein